MAKTKVKKTFLKIKEKLVFVETQQKKFFTKKFFGILLLITGLAILFYTFASYFIIPKFFKSGINLELVQREEFIPERVLFPSLGVDFLVKNRLIEKKFILSITDFKPGDEILVLGKDKFRSYLLSKVEDKIGSESGMLQIDDNNLILTLTLKDSIPKVMIINAIRKF